ncbi:hypothetical protein ACF06Q_15585 [Streptomyces leeuwenhoekii]|uniref:hypothetical protein n=1 Tax=Streptomyces leeuwenhoekii TaxID=1437453 RepID=UPI0036FFF0EC
MTTLDRYKRQYKRRITKHVRGAAAFGVEQHHRHHKRKDLRGPSLSSLVGTDRNEPSAALFGVVILPRRADGTRADLVLRRIG